MCLQGGTGVWKIIIDYHNFLPYFWLPLFFISTIESSIFRIFGPTKLSSQEVSSFLNVAGWISQNGAHITHSVHFVLDTNVRDTLYQVHTVYFYGYVQRTLNIKDYRSNYRLFKQKHRKNCECCQVSRLIVWYQRLSWIQVLNCQNCNQCLKCQKSPGLSFQNCLSCQKLSKIVKN